MSHREPIANLQMVEMLTERRRLAQASVKDNNVTERLSLLRATFLAGTLASLFSIVFLSVRSSKMLPLIPSRTNDPGNAKIEDTGELSNLIVSPQLWVYFIITIPLTIIIVATVWLWDRHEKMEKEDSDMKLETRVEELEKDVIFRLRQITMGLLG
ncbi:hypothetical protein CIB48_g5194 [Xylaria polymorpha]|nr:hypothetical protein CIB48_g5194 [Xylaria polymorpha]